MADRKPISKATRFRVFKRDEFTCQYCGNTPPSVVLEVDHMVAVAAGGDNNFDNLITACFDCNRGKGAEGLHVAPDTIAQKLERMKEREAQVRAYAKEVAKSTGRIEAAINGTEEVFWEFYGGTFSPSARVTVRRFLDKLMPEDVVAAAETACARKEKPEDGFRYFCGICWNKIKGR